MSNIQQKIEHRFSIIDQLIKDAEKIDFVDVHQKFDKNQKWLQEELLKNEQPIQFPSPPKVRPINDLTDLPNPLPMINENDRDDDNNDNKQPPLYIKKTSIRWENTKHPIDTIDDYVLKEEIHDIMDKFPSKSQTELTKEILQHYNVNKDENMHLYSRLLGIIHEIERHDKGFVVTALNLSPQNNISITNRKLNTTEAQINAGNNQNSTGIDNNVDVDNDNDNDNKTYNEMKYLCVHDMKTDIQSKEQCLNECVDDECKKIIKDTGNLKKCPCISRICGLLKLLKSLYSYTKTATTTVSQSWIGEMVTYKDVYEYQQISNDFLHIHSKHILQNHEMQIAIYKFMDKEYHCDLGDNCNAFKQHQAQKYANQLKQSGDVIPTPIRQHTLYGSNEDKNAMVAEECDRIHAYFLHSLLKFGCDNNDDDIDQDQKGDASTSDSDQEDNSIDAQWMKTINNIDIKDPNNENKIYKTLCQHVGIFKYQSAHGFRTGQYRGLAQIKPKFNSVKEEVLRNSFHAITPDAFNSTLRKAKIFKASWASKKIRTFYKGRYDDAIFGISETWERGDCVSLNDILILKLYTDFDALQHELKRCFRFESVDDIIEQYTKRHTHASTVQKRLSLNNINALPSPNTFQWSPSTLHKGYTSSNSNSDNDIDNLQQLIAKDAIIQLEKRLSEFYHWRYELLLFVNKFGNKITPTSNNPFRLYHGVNAKMIVDPTETLSFFGPLSTSSSYHVASTFAGHNGMILSITSQYPRLNLCTAFNASLVSDYKEEQEWLIGHIYLRIIKIHSPLNSYISIDSKLRYVFFAIHLFREQIFSMNNIFEKYLIPFIQIHLFKTTGNNYKNINPLDYSKSNDYHFLEKVVEWAKIHKFKDDNTPLLPNDCDNVNKISKDNRIRKNHVFYILCKKFEEFCLYPNLKQIVKIDNVSNSLKPYFFDKDDDNKSDNDYVVSFKKVICLFPNIEQIYFLNMYRFDDIVLQKLIEQIKLKGVNKLKQIKFLYYDYMDPLNNNPCFFDPKMLNQSLLNELCNEGWNLTHSKNNTGYKIKLTFDAVTDRQQILFNLRL